jgi:hypothetical protein
MGPDEKKLRQSPEIAFRMVGEEAVVMTPGDSMIHMFNGTGTFIFKLLSQPRTPEEVEREVAGAYETDKTKLSREMSAFLSELRRKGIVVPCR